MFTKSGGFRLLEGFLISHGYIEHELALSCRNTVVSRIQGYE
ncbi:hypothetical protein SBA7_1780016 [Candidatus Sulfotelmatobacter sp. SbA7]|nr:hypothetical protein SBA7_1780016 [Candidatus Sulfotelmatobacter sp. SbA7]